MTRPADDAETSALIAVDPDRADALADWLRAASDGHLIVDPDEPSRKLSGPVAISVADGDAPAATGAPLSDAPADDASRPWFVGRRPVAPGSDGPQPFEWQEPESEDLHHTPLHAFHAEHAKKLIPFAGWDMPVWYTSIAAEHEAVRKTAGLFDVGHMGVFAVSGPNAAEFLDLVATGSATRLRVGRAAYTYLLDADGNCLDDLIIYRLARDRFMAVVNAANAAKNWAWLTGVNDGVHQVVSGDGAARLPVRAELADLNSPSAGDASRLDLAFQGPQSRRVLQRLVATDDERSALDAMRMNHVRAFTLAGADVEISHTGYTGEATGFEIFVHPDAARTVWDAILEAGADDGIVPVGLGARDSTRTEAGFPALRTRARRAAGPHPRRRGVWPLRQGLQAVLRRPRPLCATRGGAPGGHRALLDCRRAGAHGTAGRSRHGPARRLDRHGHQRHPRVQRSSDRHGPRRRQAHAPPHRAPNLRRRIRPSRQPPPIPRRPCPRRPLRPTRRRHRHPAIPRVAGTALDWERIRDGQ